MLFYFYIKTGNLLKHLSETGKQKVQILSRSIEAVISVKSTIFKIINAVKKIQGNDSKRISSDLYM